MKRKAAGQLARIVIFSLAVSLWGDIAVYADNEQEGQFSEADAFSPRFPNTAYEVVTNQGRFSTVNPDYKRGGSSYTAEVKNNTAIARSEKAEGDGVWPQCVKLACILTVTTKLSEMKTVQAVPAGINVQKCFISLKPEHMKIITYSGGYFYINGIKAAHVALAGIGEIPATAAGYNQLCQYAAVAQRYNLYYTFYDENQL